jgi:hypothetical protein
MNKGGGELDRRVWLYWGRRERLSRSFSKFVTLKWLLYKEQPPLPIKAF